ncbi:MAG: hypothetical protein RR293_06820 [Bacteroidales bacterium]
MQLTLASQSATIHSLGNEIKQLRELLLERDKNAEKIIGKLNGLAKIDLPSKIVKRKIEHDVEKSVALTPKERGNNGAKRKV